MGGANIYSDLKNILHEFLRVERPFTLNDIRDSLVTVHNEGYLLSLLATHPSFLVLSLRGHDTVFLPKRVLARWLIYLSIRSGFAKRSVLSTAEILRFLNIMAAPFCFEYLPKSLYFTGCEYGFFAPATQRDSIFLPLSKLLSCALSYARGLVSDTGPLMSLIEEVWYRNQNGHSISSPLDELANIYPSGHNARCIQVMRLRGWSGNHYEHTLNEVAQIMGVSRERVRQLETDFWNHVASTPKFREACVRHVISCILRRKGSLIIEKSQDANTVLFTLRCLNIPVREIEDAGIYLMACDAKEALRTSELHQLWHECNLLNTKELACCLAKRLPEWSLHDVADLAVVLSRQLPRRCRKMERLYMVLKSFGRPAHFTEIWERYNQWFPWDTSTLRSVHGMLDREDLGIVWIGRKGTYALREWGYKRPDLSYEDMVLEIVTRKYEESGGRPVHETIVIAEASKYRRDANIVSVLTALSRHLALRRDGHFYVPRERGDTDDDENIDKFYDEVLRNV